MRLPASSSTSSICNENIQEVTTEVAADADIGELEAEDQIDVVEPAAAEPLEASNWQAECIAMLQILQGRVQSMSREEGMQLKTAIQELTKRTMPTQPGLIRVLPQLDASNAHALPQRLATRSEKLRKWKAKKTRKTCRPSEALARAASSSSDSDKDEFVPSRPKSLLHSRQYSSVPTKKT
uniref:Uncharacterized protein n=1 Tax=Plectus sambesii TaxID=2011161 RepID=A0A914W3T8_9BILA